MDSSHHLALFHHPHNQNQYRRSRRRLLPLPSSLPAATLFYFGSAGASRPKIYLQLQATTTNLNYYSAKATNY